MLKIKNKASNYSTIHAYNFLLVFFLFLIFVLKALFSFFGNNEFLIFSSGNNKFW
jgi:hypothetical protein